MTNSTAEYKAVLATLAGILITGLVSVGVAFFASRTERGFYFEKKKVDIAAEAIVHFTNYQEHWERLIAYSMAVAERANSAAYRDRQLKYAMDRNQAHDKLYSALAQAKFFFCSEIDSAIQEFTDWDEARSIETLDVLPPPIMWIEKFQPVADALRSEIREEKSC